MIKIKLLLAMTYRFEFFIGLLSQFFLLFATTFFWRAAYSGLGVVGDVSQGQMLTYNVIAIIMAGVFKIEIEGSIRDKVRRGNVAVDFIKPVNVFMMYLSEDIGAMLTNIVRVAAPILLCSALFITVPAPASAARFALFLVSSVFSYMILWLSSAIFGLFYFWVIEMGPIGTIKDYLIRILSGSFIPIWFFPDIVQNILKFLPFIYIYQHPIGIYIGRTPMPEAMAGMGVQLLWIMLFALLFAVLERRMTKNIQVQGG